MKMTPGPWEASLYDTTTNSVRVKGSEGQTVAFCIPPYVFENRKQMITECVCNAIAIAALPKLLEAAEEMISILRPYEFGLAAVKLQDAIKKTKGDN